MAMRPDPWNLHLRQTRILEALTTLLQRGQLRAEQLDEINALYARGALFEAERVAGLAIWLATSPPQALIHALPERLGVQVSAWNTLGLTLAIMDHWEMWRPYADTLESFQRETLHISPSVYGGLLQLSGTEVPSVRTTLAEHGRALHAVLTIITTRDASVRPSAALLEASAHHARTVEDLTTCAEQIIENLLWLGRTLRSIRLWELWSEHASSYAAFLDDVLGLGSPLAFGLEGLATAWDTTRLHRRALGSLDTAVQIVMGQAATTAVQKGTPR